MNPGNKANQPLLIIPVENQVRELDPKLLLACVAARRGFPSVIGSRREVELSIASFPRSVYLSKSMTVRSLLMFWIACKLRHEIVTWDEEALVHLPPEIYFSRRLDPRAIQFVSHLLAWGEDNAELWRQYPDLPAGMPIRVTGNPRGDLLRPEIRPFFEREAAAIREKYGTLILVNTNFNHVNAFFPELNLFQPTRNPGEVPRFGRGARGMPRDYAEGLRDHKQAVFDAFKEMIPSLREAFPDHTVVVRPHPTENHDVYRNIAARCERVTVTNEGNVVPWLMAARALVHNGCTTGVEAYSMGVPAVSYRAKIDERYDLGFYRLPNLVSHQCFSWEELRETLRDILDGKLGPADGAARQQLVEKHLAAQDGPLACERIVDVVEELMDGGNGLSLSSPSQRLIRWSMDKVLGLAKRCWSLLPGGQNKPEFQRHRFPGVTLDDMRSRVAKFQRLLGDGANLNTVQIYDHVFRISA